MVLSMNHCSICKRFISKQAKEFGDYCPRCGIHRAYEDSLYYAGWQVGEILAHRFMQEAKHGY